MMKMTCTGCGESIVTTSQAEPSQIICPKCGKSRQNIEAAEHERATSGIRRCVYCGSCIVEENSDCPVCGYSQPEIDLPETRIVANVVSEKKKLSFGVGLLCFFLPFLGVLLWLIDLGRNPRKAVNELLLSVFPTMLFLAGMMGASDRANNGVTMNSTGGSTVQSVSTPTFEAWMIDEFEPYDVTSVDVVGGTAIIYFDISDNLTEDMVVGGAKADVMYMLRAIDESDFDYSSVRIIGSFPMTDQYGGTEPMDVIDLRYSKSTIDQVNWSSFLYTNTFEIADSRNIHPAFQR